MKEVQASTLRGESQVVDVDLSKYFETIPHRDLMKSVARRISDRKMLHLIKMWLKAPVQELNGEGRKVRTRGGGLEGGDPAGRGDFPLFWRTSTSIAF